MDYQKAYNKLQKEHSDLKSQLEKIEKTISPKMYNLGDKYFNTLVEHLNNIVDADFTFVGELKNNSKINTISIFGNGKLLENFSYKLSDTPCENVVGSSVCSYPNKITELFPKDTLLKEMSIEGYTGVPLFNSKQIATGILVCLYKKPIQNPKLIESILLTFAARAGAEIEHSEIYKKLSFSQKELRSENKKNQLINKKLQEQNTKLLETEKELKETNKQLFKTNEIVVASEQESWLQSNRLSTLIDNMPGGILIETPDRKIKRVNQLFCDLFNISAPPETLIGFDCMLAAQNAKNLFLKPSDFIKRIEEILAEGKIVLNEELSLNDGRTFARDFLPVDIGDGLTENMWLYRNITESFQLKENLKNSKERFELSMQATSDGLFDWNLITNEIYFSPGWKSMLGYKDHELKNEFSVWEQLTDPEDVKESWEKLNMHIQGKTKRFEMEFKMRHKNGGWVDILSRANAIRDETGKAIRVIGTHVNITERKKYEKALLQSKELLSKAYENSPLAYQSLDKDGNIIDVNPTWLKLFGYKRENIIGRKFEEILPETSIKLLHNRFPQLKSEGEIRNAEFEINRSDKSVVDIELNGKAGYSNDGELERIYCILNDITDRKHEERIKAARLNLIEYAAEHSANELLQKFLDEAEILTKSNVGFYHFLKDDQETIELQAWSSNTLNNMCSADGMNKHYNISQAGVWVDCVRKRKPIIHNNYNEIKHKKGIPEGHAPILRELVVPVFRDKKIVAILGVGNKSTNYDKNDIETIQQIADLAWEIVARKQAEEELQKNANLLRQSQSVAHIGSWENNLESNQLVWSEEVYKIFGVEATKFNVSMESILNLIHPDDRETVDFSYRNSIQNNLDTYESIHRIIKANNKETRILHEKCDHIRDDTGTIIKSIGIVQDITEQKKSELALTESDRKLKSLLESTRFIAWEVDGETQEFTFMSPAIEDLSGYSAAEWKNFDFWAKTVHPDDRDVAISYCMSQTEKGLDHFFSYRMITKEGNIKWIEDHVFLVKENNKVYLRGFFHDYTEFKLAQIKLQESESKYRQLFENMTSGFALHEVICDKKGKPCDYRFIEVNPAFEKLTGAKASDFVGKTVKQVMPNIEDYWIKNYGQVALTGKPISFENYSKDINKYFNSYAFSTAPNQFAVVFYDITKRKKAEERLKQQEEHFRMMVENMPVLINAFDKNGKFIFWNKECEKVTGYKSKEVIGNNEILDKLYPDPEYKYDKIDKFKENMEIVSNLEIDLINKSGEKRTILWTNINKPVPLKNWDGWEVGIEITAQKKSQIALAESEARLKQLSDLTFEGILIHKEGIVLDVNASFVKMIGYTHEEIIGKNLIELIVPEKKQKYVYQKVKEKLNEPYELEIIRKDGSLLPTEITSRIIPNSNGTKVASFRDMTERRQMQHRITETRLRSEEQERERYANELHDGLGPILSTCKVYFHTLNTIKDEIKRKKHIERTNELLEEALRSIKEISNNLSPHILRNYGLIQAIHSFIDKLTDISSIKFTVNTNFENRLPELIEFTVYRTLVELINNSIKHSKADNIKISFIKNGNSLKVVFIDNGQGFNYEKTKLKSGGFGLLNLEQRIKDVNGNYKYISVPNKGVEVVILINLSRND